MPLLHFVSSALLRYSTTGTGGIGQPLGQEITQHIGSGDDDGGNLRRVTLCHPEGQQKGSDEAHQGHPELAACQLANDIFLLSPT